MKENFTDEIVLPSRFDARFYLDVYPDVMESGVDPYRHYLECGLVEGRRPTAIFDPRWYQQNALKVGRKGAVPDYVHYLENGTAAGMAPCRLLMPVFAHAGAEAMDGIDRYDLIHAAAVPWIGLLGLRKFDLLLALFSSEHYTGDGELPKSWGGAERLAHFLNGGLRAGMNPGPLFDQEIYLQRRRDVSPEVLDEDDHVPLIHFLRHGVEARVIPTSIFDEGEYRQLHRDIGEQSGVWGFEHFVMNGLFEGRAVRPRRSAVRPPAQGSRVSQEVANWRSFWMVDPEEAPLEADGGAFQLAPELQALIALPSFATTIRRALQHEPAIGDVQDIADLLLPPMHDLRHRIHLQIRARFSFSRYDSIVCIPWLRVGGADLVACEVAGALAAARSSERVLILQTDQTHFERPDWIPVGVEVVCIADLLMQVPQVHAEELLYTVFLGLTPRRVVNVNSRLTWQTYVRFAKRLSETISLYAYLFCWDQTADGLRVGYPSEFFAATNAHLHATFTDTEYLRNELIRLYRVPASSANRTVALFSPARTTPLSSALAIAGLAKSRSRRPRVLWAGRLDRQKRFDLVQRIAHVMPHVDFWCWGAALLDAPPDVTLSPANLTLNPPFVSYSELPLDDADLFLFTSAWEGMPTILIELAMRGMAVVASAVGGVPELIDESTGYPVDSAADADEYAEVIGSALENGQERIRRAEALQRKAGVRYSRPAYLRQIQEILASEESKP